MVIQVNRLALIWTERPGHKLTKWHIRGISDDGSFYGDVKGNFNDRIEHRNVSGTLDAKAMSLINEFVAVIESLGCLGGFNVEFRRGRMIRRSGQATQVLFTYPLEREDDSESGKAFLGIIDVLRPAINSVVE